MSPADGSTCALTNSAQAALAVILPGGRSLLALTAAACPPAEGMLDPETRWQAEAWPVASGWAGLALTGAALTEATTLQGACGTLWHIGRPPRIEIAPEPLAEFVGKAGLNSRDVLDFLLRVLPDGTEAQAAGAFLAGFVTATATTDGFIEMLAIPDCGGLFAQGWSMSLAPGQAWLGKLDAALGFAEVEVATFARDDILPPGQGFALFSRDWRGQDLAALQSLVFDHQGTLRRLEGLAGATQHLHAAAANAHVAQMLPRLAGPESTIRAMRRICRPRFTGTDTLSSTPLPVAAALDAVFQAPDGGILAMGWLLDPLARVDRVILKSTDALYAPLQDRWHSIPRPDLCEGFANDPRFTRLLDPRDAMHGFIAYAPGRKGAAENTNAYLELVLDDNSCLFRPVPVTPLQSRDRLPGILAGVSPQDPALGPLVERVLAPFLAGLPATPPRAGHRRTATVPLKDPAPARDIAAIMPFRTLTQLQPVFALLGGTPEATALDLTLVTTRDTATGLAEKLAEAFRFYDLSGRLLVLPENESLLAQFEAGIAATDGSRLLLWEPSVLPTQANWLVRLVREQQWARPSGPISPRLVYEDGSICFGAGESSGDGLETLCPQLGYPAEWLAHGRPTRVPTGAPEIALIARDDLLRAGGLSGRLFTDRLAHRDLADRLKTTGAGVWCSGGVTFWALQDQTQATNDSFTSLMAKVDGALIAARMKERPAS